MPRATHALALACLLLAACAPAADRQAPARRSTKQTLYGDASLIPTREGERVRRELALAGEIEASLLRVAGVTEVRASVELPDVPDRDRPAVLLAVATRQDAPLSRAEMAETAAHLVPNADATDVHVLVGPSRSPEEPRGRSFALPLVLLALGISLGITLERLRSRARGATR